MEGKTQVLGLERRNTIERLWGIIGTVPNVGNAGTGSEGWYVFLDFRLGTVSTAGRGLAGFQGEGSDWAENGTVSTGLSRP